MPRRDDERERPSWRDIDRKKDSSHHIDKTDPYAKARGPGRRAPAPTSGYKTALDKFFEGGELPDKFKDLAKAGDKVPKGKGSERQAALKALRDAVGRSEVVDAVKRVVGLDGELPRDPDLLAAALQHPDEEVQRDALQALAEVLRERPIKRTDLLRQRVRKVEDLAEEAATKTLAAELRKALG